MENLKDRNDKLVKLHFTDRESYFVWVRTWKQFYKELSQHIRDVKAHIHSRLSEAQLEVAPIAEPPPGVLQPEPLWMVRMQLENLRTCATCALHLRACGRKESWAMKMKELKLEKVS